MPDQQMMQDLIKRGFVCIVRARSNSLTGNALADQIFIRNTFGKMYFSDDEIDELQLNLSKYDVGVEFLVDENLNTIRR